MIQKKFYRTRKDGVDLFITFSDQGYIIEKVTKINTKRNRNRKKLCYDYAIDVASSSYEYTETDVNINYSKEEMEVMKEHGLKYWIPDLVKVEFNEDA
jgi:hypothetical protein